MFGTLVLEGAALLAEGLAPMSIERAALQAGFPAGPLTLLDEVTLTLPLKISDEAAKAGSTEDHPGLAVVRALVEQRPHRQGRRPTGFFDWEPEKRVWPGLAELYPPHDGVPFADAQERLLFAMAVETARCVEERVLTSVEDANIGSIMGIGFPPLYGGVLQYVDQYAGGVAGFVARADELADAYGERFRPPALLLERAVPAGSLRAAVARMTVGGPARAGRRPSGGRRPARPWSGRRSTASSSSGTRARRRRRCSRGPASPAAR